jgi:hypothetical protein
MKLRTIKPEATTLGNQAIVDLFTEHLIKQDSDYNVMTGFLYVAYEYSGGRYLTLRVCGYCGVLIRV